MRIHSVVLKTLFFLCLGSLYRGPFSFSSGSHFMLKFSYSRLGGNEDEHTS